MTSRVITEFVFQRTLFRRLDHFKEVKSVSGPGRSGAIASVYASHYLKVPWLPHGTEVPELLRPHLVVDTAFKSGRTLRRAARKMNTDLFTWAFEEPPRIYFWYEPEGIEFLANGSEEGEPSKG